MPTSFGSESGMSGRVAIRFAVCSPMIKRGDGGCQGWGGLGARALQKCTPSGAVGWMSEELDSPRRGEGVFLLDIPFYRTRQELSSEHVAIEKPRVAAAQRTNPNRFSIRGLQPQQLEERQAKAQ